MKVVTANGMIDNFATIIEVTDEQLDRIKVDTEYYYDKDFMNDISLGKGSNAVVLGLTCGIGMEVVLKRLLDLTHLYNTVSWYSRKSKRFFTKEIKR